MYIIILEYFSVTYYQKVFESNKCTSRPKKRCTKNNFFNIFSDVFRRHYM